jgi:glycosyltransferase involved in cell wall biosynthesis
MSKRAQYPSVSIVIPALNEANNLSYILPRVGEIAHEVILVNGRSVDETAEIARSLLPDIRIVQQTGMGKGDALRNGFDAATGDIVVMMDADGSTDPTEIPRFIDALLDGADLVKGSRFLSSGGSADITLLRKLGNVALSGIVNYLFQTQFTDLCYGYIALWRMCLHFFEVDCTGFEVETQINLRARKANLKIVEVPSYEYLRRHGSSNLNTFRDGWRVLRMIGQEWKSGYSTVKTPGVHRVHHLALLSEPPLSQETVITPPGLRLGAADNTNQGGVV